MLGVISAIFQLLKKELGGLKEEMQREMQRRMQEEMQGESGGIQPAINTSVSR
jgi:hypothetical protein